MKENMEESFLKKFAADIDRLASLLIMIDWSDADGMSEIVDVLKSLEGFVEEKNFIRLSKFIDKFKESVKYAVSVNEQKAVHVISSGISILQRYVQSGRVEDLEESESYQFETFARNLFEGKEEAQVLSQTQLNEWPAFIANVPLVLDESEGLILSIEEGRDVVGAVNGLFRIFHTLKGEAGLVGMEVIASIAHKAEAILEKVREKKYVIPEKFADVFLCTIDNIKCFVEEQKTEKLVSGSSLIKETIYGLDGLLNGYGDNKQENEEANMNIDFTPQVPKIDLSEGTDLFYEFIAESEDHLACAEDSLLALETAPDDSEHINKIFRAFHTIKGTSSFLNLEDIRRLTHETETMIDIVRKGECSFSSDIADAVLSSIDSARKLFELLREQVANRGDFEGEYFDITHQIVRVISLISAGGIISSAEIKNNFPKIGEILIDQGVITEDELSISLGAQQAGQSGKKIGEFLVENAVATQTQVDRGLLTQKKGVPAENTIKIGIDKLDQLVDMTGELVIAGTQVAQHAIVKNSENVMLGSNVALLEKIIRDIQDVSMSMRLVPIRPVFQKMQRLVRDVSRKAGKDVEMKISGEETEIDKNIIDLIGDPLMHMIRNSIDHGIEPAGIRKEKGKSEKGLICLDAYHKGGNIVIDIRDDGGGLNKEKILEKAVSKGIVREGETLPDKRIFSLIFEPGFSTAEKVTDISGRGVGMDVVRRNIDSLRGKIDIDSDPGMGTIFSIKLPLTLAIIDGIILRSSNERYIVPIFSVIEFIKPCKEDMCSVKDKGEMIKIHDELHVVLRLDSFFSEGIPQRDVESYTGCLVDSDYGRVCLFVDELLGQQQVVIKSLGDRFKNVKGLAGGTILGDGRVGLILDINGIMSDIR